MDALKSWTTENQRKYREEQKGISIKERIDNYKVISKKDDDSFFFIINSIQTGHKDCSVYFKTELLHIFDEIGLAVIRFFTSNSKITPIVFAQYKEWIETVFPEYHFNVTHKLHLKEEEIITIIVVK